MKLLKDIRTNDAVKGALLLAALTLLLFSQGLVGQFLLLGRELDFISFRYLSEAREHLGSGIIPLWTSAVFCGFPLLANPELALCYPPTWLAFLLPVHRALGVLVAVHVLLSGMLAYLFFHRRGMGRLGCFTAAGTWAFSGFVMSQVAQLPTLSSLAWMPGLFLCMEQCVLKGGLRRHATLGAVAGFQMLAGDFAVALCSQFGALLLVVLDSGFGGFRYSRRRIIGCGGFMLLSGAGLAAVQGLPLVELLEQAVPRFHESVHPLNFIVPGLAGEGSLFLGVMFLPLAGAGLFRRQGIVFGVLGLAGLACGFVSPAAMAIATIGFSGLAGHGADEIAGRTAGMRLPAFRPSVLRSLVGLHVLTLFWSGGRWIPKMRMKDFEEMRLEEQSLVRQLGAKPGHRIADMTTMPMSHSRWIPYGLESVSGFSRYVPSDVIRYTSLGEESRPSAGGAAYASFVRSPGMLQMAGCQYILVDANAAVLALLLDRELSSQLRRSSVLEEVEVASTLWKVFRLNITPWEFQPYSILPEAPQHVELVFCSDRQGAWQAISSASESGKPKVVLECDPPAMPAADGSDFNGLYFSIRHSGNMRALSDAGESRIVRSQYMFSAIQKASAASLNSDSLIYEPRTFRIGLYVSLTMLAFLCSAFVAGALDPRQTRFRR